MVYLYFSFPEKGYMVTAVTVTVSYAFFLNCPVISKLKPTATPSEAVGLF